MKIGVVCRTPGTCPVGCRSISATLPRSCNAEVTRCRSWLRPITTHQCAPYVVSAGWAVPVHYNGSVARLTFGPLSVSRVRRWLADGRFDVLHVHEPASPSLGLLAVWWADAGCRHLPSSDTPLAGDECCIRDPASAIEKSRPGSPSPRRPERLSSSTWAAIRSSFPTGSMSIGSLPVSRDGTGRAARAPCRSWAASTSRAGTARSARGMAGHLPRTAGVRAADRRPRRCRRNPAHDSGRLSRRGHFPRRGERRGQDRHVRIERRLRRPTYGERVVRDRSRRGDGRWNAGPRERTGRLSNGCGGRSPWPLVPVGDAPALAKAALELLADPARRAELRDRARIAVRRYDWSTVAGRGARGLRDGGRRRNRARARLRCRPRPPRRRPRPRATSRGGSITTPTRPSCTRWLRLPRWGTSMVTTCMAAPRSVSKVN